MLMDKWSSRSAQHNANRVRNNQRRHRARVKARTEDLETRLEETNAKLEAALSTIKTLTAEVEGFRASRSLTHSQLGLELARSSCLVLPSSVHEPAPPVPAHDLGQPQTATTLARYPSDDIQAATPTLEAVTHATGLAVPSLATVDSDSLCNCPDGAPPPALGESTMSCSSAFQIIQQQNFSGVEVTTIKAWLGPGFRLKPGEACRVETSRLYELLDHITSLS